MEITAKKEDEGKLIATLQSADAEAFDKDVACRQLAVLGTKQAVPALAALLEDDHLCDVARRALEEIPDPSADEAFRAALGKLKGRTLLATINSIGHRRDREAVEALAKRLSDPDAEVASFAAAALAEIGGREAGGALTQALADAPDNVRPAVADASVIMGENLMRRDMNDVAVRVFDRVRAANVPKHIRIAATRGAILARQGEGVDLLVEQINGEDYAMFELGLRAAQELPGADVTRKIAAQAGKLTPERRVLLLRTLGTRGDKAALPVVLEAAEKGDTAIRVAAIEAAAQIGDKSAVPALKKAAADADSEVAETAKKSLAAFGA